MLCLETGLDDGKRFRFFLHRQRPNIGTHFRVIEVVQQKFSIKRPIRGTLRTRRVERQFFFSSGGHGLDVEPFGAFCEYDAATIWRPERGRMIRRIGGESGEDAPSDVEYQMSLGTELPPGDQVRRA